MLGPRFWKVYAYFYDVLSNLLPYRQMMDNVVEALDPNSPARILDVGCGTGNLEVKISQNPDSQLRVLGIDSSVSMLGRAIAKCQGSERVEVRLMDIEREVSFNDEVFNHIVSTNVLYTLKDPEATIALLARLLKPGGIMVHTTPKEGFSPMAIFFRHCLECRTAADFLITLAAIPSLIAVGLLNILIVRDGKRSQRFWKMEELKEILESNGLEIISIYPIYADQDWLVTARKGGES